MGVACCGLDAAPEGLQGSGRCRELFTDRNNEARDRRIDLVPVLVEQDKPRANSQKDAQRPHHGRAQRLEYAHSFGQAAGFLEQCKARLDAAHPVFDSRNGVHGLGDRVDRRANRPQADGEGHDSTFVLPQEVQEGFRLIVGHPCPVCKIADTIHQLGQAVGDGVGRHIGKIPRDLLDHGGQIADRVRYFGRAVRERVIDPFCGGQHGDLKLPPDLPYCAVEAAQTCLVNLLDGIAGGVGGVGGVGHGLQRVHAQVFPHGAKQLDAHGIALDLIVQVEQAVDDIEECFIRAFTARSEPVHHLVGVQPESLVCRDGGVAAVDGANGELFHSVADLVQIPSRAVCAGLIDLEHLVGREAEFGELDRVFVDGVDQFTRKVKAVLRTGGDQVKGIFDRDVEVLADSFGCAGAFRHIIVKSLLQSQGAFGGRGQSALAQVLHVAVHDGDSVANSRHILAKARCVNILHDATQRFKLPAGSPRGVGHLSGRLLPFVGKACHVLARRQRAGPHRSHAGRHTGGDPVGHLDDGVELLG